MHRIQVPSKIFHNQCSCNRIFASINLGSIRSDTSTGSITCVNTANSGNAILAYGLACSGTNLQAKSPFSSTINGNVDAWSIFGYYRVYINPFPLSSITKPNLTWPFKKHCFVIHDKIMSLNNIDPAKTMEITVHDDATWEFNPNEPWQFACMFYPIHR